MVILTCKCKKAPGICAGGFFVVSRVELLNHDSSVFNDDCVLVAVAEVLVSHEKAADQDGVADVGGCRSSDGNVIGSVSTSTILNVQPVFTHDVGVVLNDLAAQGDRFSDQRVGLGKDLLNGLAAIGSSNASQVNRCRGAASVLGWFSGIVGSAVSACSAPPTMMASTK